MTNQEVYDKVCGHLYNQKQKAINERGDSAYKGTCGRMSPIGLFISDSVYTHSIENYDIGGLIAHHESVQKQRPLTDEEMNNLSILKEHRQLLAHLSLIQETTEFTTKTDIPYLYNMEKLKDNLIHAAKTYGLNSNLIEKLCEKPKGKTRFIHPDDESYDCVGIYNQ